MPSGRPLRSPLPGRAGYECRHGFGYTVFEHDESKIFSEMTTYVAMDAPVKFVVVKLRNHSGRDRRLSLTAYWELVLGEWRHSNLMHIVTEKDADTGALFARNRYSRQWSDRVVFAQTSGARRSVTASRTEFIGRNGSLADPGGHAARATLRKDWCRTRSVRGDPDPDRTGRWAGAGCRVRAGIGGRRGRRAEAVAAVQRSRRRPSGTGGGVGALEPHAGHRVRGDAGRRLERDGQRLADLPDALLAGCGVGAATINPAEPTVFAINCRTRWP